MSTIETNDFEETDCISDEPERFSEASFSGKPFLLPSQTRNPAYGIWPNLEDDSKVVRYPEASDLQGVPMRDHLNKEVKKLYWVFQGIAFNNALFDRTIDTNLVPSRILAKLNTAIRGGKYDERIKYLSCVSDEILYSYLKDGTYRAVNSVLKRVKHPSKRKKLEFERDALGYSEIYNENRG
ncbi:hypothetical protein COU54_03910 [Candidatus Pacearchaeota archaeon CG10_big_fil_rev_8_21_14_0_10_31_24]|nr:MAG: hypothetical protein COU54_03910 [Candidatus Pacearchaeota archaeon CG10_big_fil_rev_8_21_14_0_10_31_24]